MPIAKRPADCQVLIVDAMASMRALLKVTLRQVGFQHIDEATGGAKAIERLADRRYDLTRCGRDMPRGDRAGRAAPGARRRGCRGCPS